MMKIISRVIKIASQLVLDKYKWHQRGNVDAICICGYRIWLSKDDA